MADPARFLKAVMEDRKNQEELRFKQAENYVKNRNLKAKQAEDLKMRYATYQQGQERLNLLKQNSLMERVIKDPRLMREIAPSQNPYAKFNPQTGNPLPPNVRMQNSFIDQFLPGYPIPEGAPSRQPVSMIPGRFNQDTGQRGIQGFVAQGNIRQAPEIPKPSQPQLGRLLVQESTDNLEKLANGNVAGLSGFIGRALGQRTNVDRGVQAEAISVLRARGIIFRGNFVPEPIANANEEELRILKAFEGELEGEDAKDNLSTFEERKMALADPEIGKILILFGKKETKPPAKNIKRK